MKERWGPSLESGGENVLKRLALDLSPRQMSLMSTRQEQSGMVNSCEKGLHDSELLEKNRDAWVPWDLDQQTDPNPIRWPPLLTPEGPTALLCPYLLWKETLGPRAGYRYSESHFSRSIKCSFLVFVGGRKVSESWAGSGLGSCDSLRSCREFRPCWAQGMPVPVELVSPPFPYSDSRLSLAFLDLRLVWGAWADWGTGT